MATLKAKIYLILNCVIKYIAYSFAGHTMNFSTVSILFFSLFCISQTALAARVAAEKAETLLINPTRSSPALVLALNHSVIPAQTAGVINKLTVNVGDKVNKDDVLALLDCEINTLNYNAQLASYEQMNTQRLFNKRELVRGKSLLKQKNIGEAELDRLTNAVESSTALLKVQQTAVDRALLNKNRCQIKAPFAGIVTKRLTNLGEMITVGKPLIELVEDKRLEISARIATTDQGSFNQAKSYVFTLNQKAYPARLRALLPVIESNARSQEARFTFTEQHPIAGSAGRVKWESPTPYLPAFLLQRRNGHSGYFIVENDNDKDNNSDNKNNKKAKFITVPSAEEGRPILFNLSYDVQIITDGRYGVNDGDVITLSSKNTVKRKSPQPKGDAS